jgi:hypothetical protein
MNPNSTLPVPTTTTVYRKNWDFSSIFFVLCRKNKKVLFSEIRFSSLVFKISQ